MSTRRSLLVAVVMLGLVLAVAGVLVAWQAILHNNIIARRFRNPWPGHLMAAAGLVIAGGSIRSLRRRPR